MSEDLTMHPDDKASANEVRLLTLPEIVTFPDEVDITNAARYGAPLFGACRPGVALVVADLSQTAFCDSSGIRCLLAAQGQADIFGVKLHIVLSSPVVLRALELLGVDQLLDIYPTMAAALDSVNGASS